MKAKLIGKIYDRYGKFVDLEYEYRGKNYFVRNHFSGNDTCFFIKSVVDCRQTNTKTKNEKKEG